MPVFNASPFLGECLRSIQTQSGVEWELVAVNDFSTDNSLEILQEFAAEDARIHVFSNLEKGIIPALRMTLAKSQGNYVTRMDADDIMPADKLASMAEVCASGTVVTGKVQYFRSDAPLGDGYTRYADWINGLVDTNGHWEQIYKECVIPSPAWMMTRETLIRIGGFDSGQYPEDYDLAFRMYMANLEVIGLDKVLHHWRDHSERASRNDINYSDNRFLDLKLSRFLQIDFEQERPLALWGAGKKGKYCAQYLKERGVVYSWHTDNPKKQEKDIYGVVLSSPSEMPSSAQCLLTMASPSEQTAVANWLASRQDVQSYWLA